MKKKVMSPMALAAIVLLLSGTFAAAGEIRDVNQNDNGTGEGNTTVAGREVKTREIIDVDLIGPPGPGRQLVKPRFKPRPRLKAQDKGPVLVDVICLNFPVMGQWVCWSDTPVKPRPFLLHR